MKTIALLLAAVLTPAAAFAADAPAMAQTAVATTPAVGKMLYSTGGKKLAPVYRLDAAMAPQILLEGKLVTVPAATLTEVDGRVETSMTRKDLLTRR